MRYPIILFSDEPTPFIFDTHDEHWNFLEAYDLDIKDVALDSDGRVLLMTDGGNDRVEISDSGAEPDPERLRSMLIQALREVGEVVEDDASLAGLITTARARRESAPGVPIGEAIGNAISGVLRFFRLKGPES